MIKLSTVSNGVLIQIKVVPGASRDRIAGELGGALKITVAAPPQGGKANKAVARLLAKALNLRASQVQVVRGTTSPNKSVLIQGIDKQAVLSVLSG